MIPIEKEEDLFWSLVFLLVRLDLSWTIQWKVLSTWEHCVFNDDLGPMHIYLGNRGTVKLSNKDPREICTPVGLRHCVAPSYSGQEAKTRKSLLENYPLGDIFPPTREPQDLHYWCSGRRMNRYYSSYQQAGTPGIWGSSHQGQLFQGAGSRSNEKDTNADVKCLHFNGGFAVGHLYGLGNTPMLSQVHR